MTAQTEDSSVKDRPDLNEVLFSWKSPSHPYKKRTPVFYQTVAAITFLLVVIVFLLHEFMLIGVILSIAFVAYVLSTVPPIEVEHKIKPVGFENAGRLYKWMELYSFWFEEKWKYKTLVIQTRLPFPGQIRAVIGENTKEKTKSLLGKYLVFNEKPQKSMVDNISDWLSDKIPLESSS